MDQADRDKLTENQNILVSEINWPEIFPKLINHGIFHKIIKNVQWWGEHLDMESNNREIYSNIEHRGPEAFKKFVLCLKETGRNDLARLLEPDNDINYDENQEVQNDDPITEDSLLHRSDSFYKKLQHSKTPLKIYLKKSTEFQCPTSDKILHYMMNSKPRGLVLIINNISFQEDQLNRSAAEHDENNLEDLFKQMGFKVKIVNNLTREEMLKTVLDFSKQPELRHVHSTFVIIMSHGNEHVQDNRRESVILGVDHKVVMGQEIQNFFTASACPDMCKKPKIFIFQTCRGNKKQPIVISKNVSMGRHNTDTSLCVKSNESTEPVSCRDISDMFIANSTLPGYVAYRDTYTGSWYIQILCEVIMNHAYNTELLRLFQMTDERLSSLHTDSREHQTSTWTAQGFTKKCYLNPGLFQD